MYWDTPLAQSVPPRDELPHRAYRVQVRWATRLYAQLRTVCPVTQDLPDLGLLGPL